MKEDELRKVAECSVCGKKIGECGVPIFYRVRIQQYVVDLAAVQRQAGLGAMLNPQLAMVMGADEDMAKMMDECERTVCNECVMSGGAEIAAII